MHYLGRSVGDEDEIVERFVTKTSDKAAALTVMTKALKRHGVVAEVFLRTVQRDAHSPHFWRLAAIGLLRVVHDLEPSRVAQWSIATPCTNWHASAASDALLRTACLSHAPCRSGEIAVSTPCREE